MAYRHYWKVQPTNIIPARFVALGHSTQVLVRVAGERGIAIGTQPSAEQGRLGIHEGVIAFNGVGEDGHETFWFDLTPVRTPPTRPEDPSVDPEGWWRWYDRDRVEAARGWRWGFCQTERKPYDAVVCAFLLRAKDVLGKSLEISSDGGWEDWRAGREIFEESFGFAPSSPF